MDDAEAVLGGINSLQAACIYHKICLALEKCSYQLLSFAHCMHGSVKQLQCSNTFRVPPEPHRIFMLAF